MASKAHPAGGMSGTQARPDRSRRNTVGGTWGDFAALIERAFPRPPEPAEKPDRTLEIYAEYA